MPKIKKTLKEWCEENNRMDLLEEWDYEKNGELTPDTISAHNGKQVWWKCKNKHEWQAVVASRVKGVGCPYCANKKVLKGYNDFETFCKNNNMMFLLDEWNYIKNAELGITPQTITAGSDKKVWWKCIHGHEWKASIAKRTNGRNCPICRNKTSFSEQSIFYYIKQYFPDVINRYTDLGMELDIYIPSIKIAVEYDGIFYHKERNEYDKLKNQFCKQNGIKLIRIRECGLCSYDDSICIFREDNNSCDDLTKTLTKLFLCLNRNDVDIDVQRDRTAIYEQYKFVEVQNSLAVKFPEIAAEWHPTLNGNLKPENFSCGSGVKVWWLCKNGHIFDAGIDKRTSQGRGCPYCANKEVLPGFNDLKTWCKKNYKEHLLQEWHNEKNGELTPDDVTHGSGKKVWWKCAKGHEWQSIVAVRTIQGCGCPKCSINTTKKIKCIETGIVYDSLGEAERRTNISRVCIARCCKRNQKTAGGYHWEYAD